MTSHPNRRTWIMRIVLGVCAALLLAVVALAGWNLRAAGLYNRASATLAETIGQAGEPDGDVRHLLAQQQQTDTQLAEARRASALLLPSVRDAIDHNASVSAALTDRLQRQLDATQQEATTPSGSASNGQTGDQPALTDEQRQQIEEMLRNNEQQSESEDKAVQQDGERHAGTDESDGDAKPW